MSNPEEWLETNEEVGAGRPPYPRVTELRVLCKSSFGFLDAFGLDAALVLAQEK